METTTQVQPPLQSWALPATAWSFPGDPNQLEAVAQGFDPIRLEQMEAVALLDRTDIKFLMSTEQLSGVLASIQQDYWILSVGDQRLNRYRTLYFDTHDFDLYNLHVNGRSDRYKVRSREYTDSQVSFLEVKRKTNKDRTIKERIPTSQPITQMTMELEEWLNGVFPYDSRMLEPKIWNTFTRLTLVGKQLCERVTMDVDLTLFNDHKFRQLEGIAIAEAKMDRAKNASPFLTQMRARRIYPQGFSKYCIGIAMLYDGVKKNALKPKLLWLENRMAA